MHGFERMLVKTWSAMWAPEPPFERELDKFVSQLATDDPVAWLQVQGIWRNYDLSNAQSLQNL